MRQNRSYYFFAILALPLWIVLQNPQTVESVHKASLSVMHPLMITANGASRTVVEVRDSFVLFWKTFRENKIHGERVVELESQLVGLQELTRENERLKSLLLLRNDRFPHAVAARVIGWDPSWSRKIFILDKGTRQGLTKDMAVAAHEGLVGRILEAGASSSRVLLITDPDARVSAIAAQSRSQGIIGGNGTSLLQMFYLELDCGAAIGEEVLTSGAESLFPKGLRIGKIISLAKSAEGLHLTAQIEPFIHFSKLEEVLCLGSSPPSP